jgi:GT2 family glycosyltransferase
MLISFVILNYNGKELTERCIDSLTRSISEVDYEIIVVDNGSSDGSVEYLKNKFPSIKIVEEGYNKFITAYNDGVKKAKGEWVFLLNNDMLFEKGFLDYILPHLTDEDIFAIGSKMVNPERQVEKNANYPDFKCGYLWIKTKDVSSFSPTIYIGCHGIFNKKKFLELGGFDPMYSPFYSEDLDLCYRAWKRGWKVYVEPKSVIIHYHMATIGKLFNRKYVLRVAARNHFLFIWKNFTSKRLFIQHILCLPLILLGAFFLKKWYYIPAFFDAMRYISEIKSSRKSLVVSERMSDSEVINFIKKGIESVLYAER